MRTPLNVLVLTTAASLAVMALAMSCSQPAESPAPAHADPATPVVRLAVAGASNTNASVAAHGRDVVVAWAATTGDVTNIQAAMSHDGGATFGAPVRVNDVDGDARVTGEQAPRVAIGRDVDVAWTSKRGGHSQVRLARSTDGGATFLPAVTLHDLALSGARGWASLATDDDGVVHAVWLDGRDANASTPSMPGMAHMASGAESHAMHESMRQDVFETTLRPDGTRSEVRLATNVCFCCKTSVSIGPGGEVFAAWRSIYPTNLRDMAVAGSTDGGKTFAAPVRVSEDHWQIDACPEDGPSTVVTGDGVLHIVWPTIIGNADPKKAIFYSSSSDGGKTFAPRLRIDDDDPARGSAHPQISQIGGRVVVVWDESVDGQRVVRAREISPATAGSAVSPGPIATVSGPESAVYPAVAGVDQAVVIAWTTGETATSEIRVRRWSK